PSSLTASWTKPLRRSLRATTVAERPAATWTSTDPPGFVAAAASWSALSSAFSSAATLIFVISDIL
ncbi:hypothetical protein PENTCL1PPCAC_9683, partial [Pristionchus entomophagus]